MRERLVTELEKSQSITPQMILNSLTTLPLYLKSEFETPVTSLIPELRKVHTIEELFLYINPMISYIDYDLLKILIESYGSADIKRDMAAYVIEIKHFFDETTLDQVMDVDSDHLRGHDYEFVSKALFKFRGDPQLVTIADLNQLRYDICSGFRLSHCIFTLKALRRTHSFLVVWSFHPAFLEYIIKSAKFLDQKFYEEHGILSLSINAKTKIYPLKVMITCVYQ